MRDTATAGNEIKKTCGPMPLWLVAPSPGRASSLPGIQGQPFAPSINVIGRIPLSDLKKRMGRAEGAPILLRVEAAEISPERVSASPLSPVERLATISPYVKPGNLCGPRMNSIADVRFTAQSGSTDRRGQWPGRERTSESPILCSSPIEIDAWRAEALGPSDPATSAIARIVFETETGTSAEIRRPKQALRELVLPSPRPWSSLTIPWESFRGFQVALPTAVTATEGSIQTMLSITLWENTSEMPLHGRRPMRDTKELAWRHAPLPEDVRTKLPRVQPIAVVEPVMPGLKKPYHSGKPVHEIAEPFTKAVTQTLPMPQDAEGPAPGVALSNGLSVWTGTINSYSQRSWSSPRWRDGGRAIQMLRLAPTVQLKEEQKISAA